MDFLVPVLLVWFFGVVSGVAYSYIWRKYVKGPAL